MLSVKDFNLDNIEYINFVEAPTCNCRSCKERGLNYDSTYMVINSEEELINAILSILTEFNTADCGAIALRKNDENIMIGFERVDSKSGNPIFFEVKISDKDEAIEEFSEMVNTCGLDSIMILEETDNNTFAVISPNMYYEET